MYGLKAVIYGRNLNTCYGRVCYESLMLQVNLPVTDTTHPQNNKFVTCLLPGVMDAPKLNDSPGPNDYMYNSDTCVCD